MTFKCISHAKTIEIRTLPNSYPCRETGAHKQLSIESYIVAVYGSDTATGGSKNKESGTEDVHYCYTALSNKYMYA